MTTAVRYWTNSVNLYAYFSRLSYFISIINSIPATGVFQQIPLLPVCLLLINFVNSLDPDQARYFVGSSYGSQLFVDILMVFLIFFFFLGGGGGGGDLILKKKKKQAAKNQQKNQLHFQQKTHPVCNLVVVVHYPFYIDPLYTNGFFHLVWYNKLRIVHCIYLGPQGCRVIIIKNIVFFCLKIFFTFTNSVAPDEMQHYAAFHLGLHCLQKYLFRGFPNFKGLRGVTFPCYRCYNCFSAIVFCWSTFQTFWIQIRPDILSDMHSDGTREIFLKKSIFKKISILQKITQKIPACKKLVCFDLILYVPSTIFQSYRDGSSWVEPVLSWDQCVLLKDTTQWRRWGSNPQPLGLESSTLPLSHWLRSPMQVVNSISASLFSANNFYFTLSRLRGSSVQFDTI